MNCVICGGDTTEDEYKGDVCDDCGAIHPEDKDWVELRDVIVELWQISQKYDDNREPDWDTEYAVKIHIDARIVNGSVLRADHTFESRHLDEVGIMGVFISREIHGEFQAEVDKMRINVEEEHEYIEMTNGGEFSALTKQR